MRNPIEMSVIIPCFNSADTLEACITSVLNQTTRPVEIITVDDNSSDNTFEVLEKLSTISPIELRVIHLRSNKGPGNARNQGWNCAKGSHVAFLDADDKWHPKKIEVMVSVIKKFPETKTFAHAYELETSKTVVRRSKRAISEVPLWRFLISSKVATPTIIIKRSLDLRFNPSMKYCEDYDLLLRLASQGPIIYVNDALATISRPIGSSGGLSANLWAMRKGEVQAYWHLAQLRISIISIFPALVLWSMTKHLYRALRRNISYPSLQT